MEFLKPKPFSPVHRALKFSAVLGTMLTKSSIVNMPIGSWAAAIVKKTTGLLALEKFMTLDRAEST